VHGHGGSEPHCRRQPGPGWGAEAHRPAPRADLGVWLWRLPVVVPARGRVPKWCSSSCRHRAWEMARGAQSGRAAVHVVDRVVEVDRPIPVIEQVLVSPHGRAWPQALAELDAGRLYDRDLPALADALGQVLTALDRRPGWRRQHGG
jgi:hypothetical protein